MRRARLAAAALLASATAAASEPVVLSGYVEGRLGYGSNPFLDPGNGTGAGSAGFSLAPVLSRSTARTETTLSGFYNRDQYFRTYGHSQTISIAASHTAKVRENLTLTLGASYAQTDNPLFSPILDTGLLNDFTVGQKSRQVSGNGEIQWQATGKDSFHLGANAVHASYPGNFVGVGGYDQYGGNFGYLRTLNARTSAGIEVTGSVYRSDVNPDSRSIQPAFALQRTLNAIWKFDGNIGIILQHTSGPNGGSSKGLGFQANLCGTYPRFSVCVSGARQSTPSGFGGLRISTNALVTVSTQLTEHSSLSGNVSYQFSNSQRVAALREGKVFQAQLNYQRDLTRRLSAGAGASYQTRTLGGYGSAHSVAGTINIRMKIGRVK